MTRACRPLTAWRRRAAPLGAAALLVAVPAAADTCSGLALGTPSVQATGAAPVAVVAADFNRDGKLDVVTANSGGNSVSLLLGSGLGGLSASSTTGAGTSPVDLVAGDLDRDGFLDLVVASSAGPDVALLRGLSPGTSFESQAAFGAGAVPTRLALGDFNRDGRPDLVVVSEAGNRVAVFAGNGTVGFGSALASLTLSAPVAAVPGDFDRDGDLDLAVALRTSDQVTVLLNNGAGGLSAGPVTAVGDDPVDLAAADVDRDGRLDLVTANQAAGAVGVFRGTGGGSFTAQTPVTVGGRPSRVALLDLDRDGALDLAVLDLVGLSEALATPRLVAFRGQPSLPSFDPAPFPRLLPYGSAPRGLAVADFTSDGRADLATTLSLTSQVALVPDDSGTGCARSSFAAAPRSYAVPDGPVSAATADFDGDGRADMAIATDTDRRVRVRRGVTGDFVPFVPDGDLGPFSLVPRGVATADFDFDGRPDLAVALGEGPAGEVRVFLGNGAGSFVPGPTPVLAAGSNTSAVAVGDFDGNGSPDLAATAEASGDVWVFLGNGAGAFTALAGNPVRSGLAAPRALVAADLTGDGLADIAVAESGASAVHVLRSNGGGSPFFTVVSGGGLPVGTSPWGIAAGNLDGDAWPDLVTADNGTSRVSVIRRTPIGGFVAAVPYTVDPNPTAVALVELTGDASLDIAVTLSGNRTLAVLANGGGGTFSASSQHPVRGSPRAIAPLDADADGRLDLAVACRSADAVVLLLSRPPTLQAAPRVGAGDQPRGAVSADLDGDGDLDLAVANFGSATVSLLWNDGAGGFPLPHGTSSVGAGAEAIVAADFDRDGRIDLAVNAPSATPTRGVSILLASPAPAPTGQFEPWALVPVGSTPDALAVGDFDRNGTPDLAVCDATSPGHVRILLGNGNGGFTLGSSVQVANEPTALVAADFNRDGQLDLAVGNAGSENVQVLTNAAGSFTLSQTLALPGTDGDPLSLAAGDFDADGAADLAVAAQGGDRLHVYRNVGGALEAAPSTSLDAPYLLRFVAAADMNLDGRPDLLTVATGLGVFRGRAGGGFEPAETVVAGWLPWAAVAGDFNRDGRPDVAVANEDSDDVSLLLSSSCQARRLDVAAHPAACETGPAPYGPTAEVRAYDEGGNLATCAAGTVVPSIAPGTGDPLATLGGSGVSGLPLASGVASFTGLTVDRPGRRYRLQFTLGALPPARTRSFTLGPQLAILGTPSICPGGSSTFTTEGSYDEYAWTLAPPDAPPAYTPSLTLFNPPVQNGLYTLGLSARVDGCFLQTTRPIYGGPLQPTTLTMSGVSAVCVDCIGGTITPSDLGGGPLSRQWGYRVTPAGTVTPMPGEAGETYTLKGASFPGPGSYYVVVTTTPTCGSTQVSVNEIAVSVLAAVPTGEVQHLAASSRGTGASGRNDLRWVNSTTAADEVLVRWNKAPDGSSACAPPLGPTAPADGEESKTPSTGTKDGYDHTGLALDTAYCYSVFVRRSAAWSPGRTVKARPFDAVAGPVKWAYATGATSVVAPVVGHDAILALSNDRSVHALTRGGATGGDWPAGFVPHPLTGVAHARSPVVPFAVPVGGADAILFAGDDQGDVHAFDAATGVPVWRVTPAPGATITGAPGAILQQYGGIRDLVLVGTRRDPSTSPSDFLGLRLSDGATLASFNGGGTLGPVNGAPAVDSANQRVYFTSRRRAAGGTAWAVNVGLSSFTQAWSVFIGESDTSPVLRGNRVYVGDTLETVYSLDAANGDTVGTFTTGDGPVNGFLFPDRRNDALIFATNTRVWSISDTGATTMPWNWQWTVAGLSPSLVLYWPQTNLVYVGGPNGRLYELDFTFANQATPPTHKEVVLGAGEGRIGAPTLDIGVQPPDVTAGKKLLVVGSESGVLYGVEVPF